MRFLVDAQLPPALVRLLSQYGHVAQHVTDIGPGDALDRDLWRYALEHDAVLVTKDADFPDMFLLDATLPLSSGSVSGILDARPCSSGSSP